MIERQLKDQAGETEPLITDYNHQHSFSPDLKMHFAFLCIFVPSAVGLVRQKEQNNTLEAYLEKPVRSELLNQNRTTSVSETKLFGWQFGDFISLSKLNSSTKHTETTE